MTITTVCRPFVQKQCTEADQLAREANTYSLCIHFPGHQSQQVCIRHRDGAICFFSCNNRDGVVVEGGQCESCHSFQTLQAANCQRDHLLVSL